MSASISTAPLPAASVPVVVGTSKWTKFFDHLKQPSTVGGLVALVVGVAGLVTGGVSAPIAIPIIGGGITAIVFPDNSTDKIKTQDVTNALTAAGIGRLSGVAPVKGVAAGSLDGEAQAASGMVATVFGPKAT